MSTATTGVATGTSLDALFGALADPTRRRLIERLLLDGPATATVLFAEGAITRQAVVKHLGVLEAAGLVVRERRGREVFHRAVPERLAAAVGWLLDTAGQWDRRVDRLRAAAHGREDRHATIPAGEIE